jgi:cell division protein FtsB
MAKAKPKAKRPSIRGGRRPARSSVLLRWLAVAVVFLVAFLYYRPLHTYLDKRGALARQQAQVRALRAEHERLRRRVAVSGSTGALLLEARRLGLVKPGERLFIVKGIEAWRRSIRRHG